MTDDQNSPEFNVMLNVFRELDRQAVASLWRMNKLFTDVVSKKENREMGLDIEIDDKDEEFAMRANDLAAAKRSAMTEDDDDDANPLVKALRSAKNKKQERRKNVRSQIIDVGYGHAVTLQPMWVNEEGITLVSMRIFMSYTMPGGAKNEQVHRVTLDISELTELRDALYVMLEEIEDALQD
jgi:hypothetical protein